MDFKDQKFSASRTNVFRDENLFIPILDTIAPMVSAAIQFWLVLNGRDLKPTPVSALNPRVDVLRQNQQQRTHFSIWESMQIEELQKGRGLKGSKIFSRLIFIASIVRKLYTLKMEKEKWISCFLILMLVVLQQLHKSFKNYHFLCS